jgi:dipeptidyl-peptidase-4
MNNRDVAMKTQVDVFKSALAVGWWLGMAACLFGDEPAKKNDKRLTLDRVFQANEFDPKSPPAFQWGSRRSGYTTLEKPADGGAGRDLVWQDPAFGSTEVVVSAHRFVPPGEEAPLNVESYTFSSDESKLLIFANSKRVWRTRTRGDYWVLDINTGELKKLGGDAPRSSLMFAKFSPDAMRVGYVRENNLYVQELHSLKVTQLTTDGTPKRINGTFDWVYEEELNLQDGFRWSPDSRSIAYWQIDDEGVREIHLLNSLDSLYPELQSIPYPKVGETNPSARIGVVGVEGGETKWLAISGDPREHYLSQLDWTSDSKHLILQQFNRLQNTNRLMTVDLESGELRTLITERDAAWVENSNSTLQWIENQSKLVWLSERDGWQHAYSVSRDNGETKLLTPGRFDVVTIEGFDAKDGWMYYIASPENPTQRYLYRIRLDGSQTERITPADQPGTHTYSISPDGKWAMHTYSTFMKPPSTSLVSLPDHKQVGSITSNEELEKKLGELDKTETEFFRVPVSNDVMLDAWCIKPPKFDDSKKYPVLFYVYGEPWGQTVMDRWGGKRHLWHLLLAQEGYVVMSVDNRGTPAPRGRDWRKIVYRQVGVLSSADQAQAVQQILKNRTYLDPKRVAIWGWSGGGSMTLNAIFRYPDIYQAAISVAPVPNQRLYDSIYQERYMGLPGDNATGYRQGSPITYAQQLKGELMVIHGTGDDNVHFQGTEMLINELIAHNKQVEMFAYPSRTHAIAERKNTARHLYGLMTRFLKDKVSVEVDD